MKANFKREVKRNKNKHKIRRETRENGPFCPGWYIHPGLKVGRGLGIFPARPKTPFVPGGGFTRDKRGASYIFAQPPPSSYTQFLDRSAPRRRRLAHRASCSAAVPERRPSSAACTPRLPWTTTPPGHSPISRRRSSCSPPPHAARPARAAPRHASASTGAARPYWCSHRFAPPPGQPRRSSPALRRR